MLLITSLNSKALLPLQYLLQTYIAVVRNTAILLHLVQVSPAFFMFFLQSELQLHDCTRRRRREMAGISQSSEAFRGW